MAGIIGKWELVSSEKFEDYMAAIGLSAKMIATAANALTPDTKLSHKISREGETWTMATTTPLGNREIRFKLGQEFETKTLDGRTVTITVFGEYFRMAGIIGKWELVSSEKFEEYMAAIGVSAEMIATAARALTPDAKLSHKISRDGETWTMATTTPIGSREIRFKLGHEFETKTLDGRTVKCAMSLDGDSLVEIQTGDGFESKNIRTPIGDQMTTTLSGNGITCTRVYKRLN